MAREDVRRNLPRILFVLAAAGYVASTWLSWAVGEAVARPTAYHAYEGGEGVWLMIVAAALAVLGVSGILTEATSRTLQLVPAALAVISAFMWQGADTQAQYAINFWVNEAGTGEMTAVRWICIGAIAANGVGWLLAELWRPAEIRKRTQPITRELGLNRWGLASLFAAVVLGLLGGMAAIYVILTAFGSKAAILGILLAVIGLFAGAAIGVRLVRWLRKTVSRA